MWKDVLNLVWGEYLRYFRFESPEEEERGRIVWELIAANNYPKLMYRWKERAEKQHRTISVARNHHPKWTSPTVWKELCDYWMSEEFIKASELRQKNRSSSKGIPHASGNKTFEERKLKLWKSLGQAPTQWELFNETHMTKRGGSTEKKFITEDAENFSETYAKKLREANGLEPTAPVNGVDDPELKIYEEAVGGVKKGRLVGRPGEKWSKRSGHVSSSDFATQVALQQSSQEVKKLKEQLAESERKRQRYETTQNANFQRLFQYIEIQAAKHENPPPPRPSNFNANSSSEGASNTQNDKSPTNLCDDELVDDDMCDDDMGDGEMGDGHMGDGEYGDYS